MKLLLEDHVPYDTSALWGIHDAYYAERGIAAWTAGDVPYAATSNSGVARQHARLFVELVRELTEAGTVDADEPLLVLEVGGGAGNFALNFVDALAHLCGEAGAALAPRLRYLLSDYSEKNLAEATANRALATLVEAGTVVPLAFDLREPGALALPGKKRRRPELVAVIFNYIACVSPLKALRRVGGRLLEKHVRLSIEVDDEAEAKRVAATLSTIGEPGALPDAAALEKLEAEVEWRPLDLARAFPRATDRAIIDDAFAALGGEATLHYPHVFLDLLRGLRPRLRAGGLLLVSDFGSPGRADVHAPTNDRAPIRYGLSLAHDVDFVVFDAFAAREGLSLLRTDDALRDLHTVALRALPALPDAFRAAFERTHRRRALGQELLDLSAAAAASFDGGRFTEAARLYGLCLRLAPRSPHVIHRWAQACLATRLSDARALERVARRLRRGKRLDVQGKLDWDTLLGGAYVRLGDAGRARRLLERSIERAESAAKWSALAAAYERLGERERAYRAHLRALELDPESEAARLTLERLAREYLLGDGAPVGWRGDVGPPG